MFKNRGRFKEISLIQVKMRALSTVFLDGDHICNVPPRGDPLAKDIPILKRLILRCFVVSEKHPYHRKYLESENEILFEKQRHVNSKSWFVLHPFSVGSSIWETFMFFVYVIDLFSLPFFSHWELDGNLTVSYIVLRICLLNSNILKQFLTAHVDEELMITVYDIRGIAMQYLSSVFIIDFIGAFPWRGLILYLTMMSGHKITRDITYYIWSLRFMNIFNLRLLYKSTQRMLAYFNATASTLRLIRLVVFFVVFVHWCTIFMIYVPLWLHATNLPNVKESWQNEHIPSLQNASVAQLYLAGLFRTLSLVLMMGVGTTKPKTTEDVCLSIIIMVIGRLFMFYSLEEILALGSWVKSPRIQYHIMMGRVNGFIRRRQLPPVAMEKVRMFYERRLNCTYFREQQLQSLMSKSLRDELLAHDMRFLMRNSKLLRVMPRDLADSVVRHLTLDVYMPNDVVLRAGSTADAIYFIASGTLAIYSRNGEELGHIEDGDYFGEMEILIPGIERRLSTAVAIELSEIYRMSRDDFLRLVRTHPEAMAVMDRMAVKRWDHVRMSEITGSEFFPFT